MAAGFFLLNLPLAHAGTVLFQLLISMQVVSASNPAKTLFVPFDLSRHVVITGQIFECSASGDAVVTGVAWGSDSDEVFKALARENGLPQKDFDKYQGPFKTYRDYVRGIESHRDLYLQLLRSKGFSTVKVLTAGSAEGSIDFSQDPQVLSARLTEALKEAMTEIAGEKGWATITAYIDGLGFERDSPRCRHDEK